MLYIKTYVDPMYTSKPQQMCFFKSCFATFQCLNIQACTYRKGFQNSQWQYVYQRLRNSIYEMIVVPSCQIVSVGKYSNVILPSVSIGKSSSSIKAFPCQDNALHWNAMFFFIILIDKIEYPLTYLYITELCHYAKKL